MIAWAGAERLAAGVITDPELPARPRWPLDEIAAPALGAGKRAPAHEHRPHCTSSALARSAPRWRWSLPKRRRQVTLWSRDPEQGAAIEQDGENTRQLPGVSRPSAIRLTADPADLADAEAVLFAVPAQALRGGRRALASKLPRLAPMISCAKGIERETGQLTTEVLASCIPGATVAALSGPGLRRRDRPRPADRRHDRSQDIGVAERLSAALSSKPSAPMPPMT
jgi:hypothetical protein